LTRFGVLWPLEAADPAVHAQSIANTGCTEVRLQLVWRQVETASGSHNWAHYDNLIATIRSKGLGVLPMVYQTPPWHRPRITDPPDPWIYARFVVEVARRYGFGAIELWNEPNWRISPTQPLDWGGTFEQYADLYRASRQALHAYNGDISAVVGGLAYVTGIWSEPARYTPSDFLRWIWDRLGPVDAVALHPYGFDPDPVADTFAKTKQLVSFLNSKGSVAPVDLTEVGMTVPPETEKERSGYLRVLATKLKDWKRVRRCTVFTWYGSGENEKWSIAKADGSWKGGASGYSRGIKS
jgi:hypothetical protein